MNLKSTVFLLATAALLSAQPLKLTSGEYSVELSATNLTASHGSQQMLTMRDFFKPVLASESVQAAVMVLQPGQNSSDRVENEHPASEQWMLVMWRGRTIWLWNWWKERTSPNL